MLIVRAAKRVAIKFWIVLLFFSPSAVLAADPLGGLTLGVALKAFSSELKEILEKAIGGGLMLEIQAGGQIGVLIQQANAAYQADLDLTYDRLNAGERETVASIRSLLDDYSKQIYGEAKDITKRAQQVANSIPLSRTLPQLTSFSPAYVTQDSSAPIEVVLNGNFVDLARQDYDAYASVNGGTPKKSARKSTQEIGFLLAPAELKRNPQQVSSNYVDISVPYSERGFLFFTQKKTATFTIPVAVLSASAGTFVLTTDVASAGVERQSFTTREMQQESGDDDIKCRGEHADLAIHSVPPDPGWTVVPSSVYWEVTWSQGKQGVDEDWWLADNCSQTTAACLCVSTEHHARGTSGKVHFKIHYAAERPTTNHTRDEQSVGLPWGGQKVFETPVGSTWKATFKRFDGKTFDIASSYQDPFINVSVAGNSITVRTAP